MGITKRHAWAMLAAAVAATIAVYGAALLYDRQAAPRIVISSSGDSGPIVVSVQGAVVHPGVYTLPGEARVNDALQAAGGTTADADLSVLNPAERLRDEQQLVVPSLLAAATPSGVAGAAVTLVNINTASIDDLDRLPGIGPALAGRIVAYREANGPFGRVEELARVDGISPEMVDELRPLITIGP